MLDNVAIDTPEYGKLRGNLMDNMRDIESSLLSILPEIGKLEDTRKSMGTDKGKLNNAPRKKVLEQINRIVQRNTGIDMLASFNSELNSFVTPLNSQDQKSSRFSTLREYGELSSPLTSLKR